MLEQWYYLSALIVSIVGLATIDRRYKLAYWYDKKRTVYTISSAVGIFIVWDILGIALGIFRHGGSDYTLPTRLAPEFPVEELFFLVLLSYSTLVIYTIGKRIW